MILKFFPFELVHAEHAQKIFVERYIKKKKFLMVAFEPICKFPKRFLTSLLFEYFLLVSKNLKKFSFLPRA
jgi:hypothetical protein